MKNPTIICGIDPGLNGAFAFINLREASLNIIDMPTIERNKKKFVDPTGVGAVLRLSPPDCIFLELVHASPQMGVTSAFSFGRSTGIVLGACATADVPIKEISPSVWKPAMSCTKDKKQTAAVATELLPYCASAWKLVKHADRAEAALMALYGAVTLGFKIPTLYLKNK